MEFIFLFIIVFVSPSQITKSLSIWEFIHFLWNTSFTEVCKTSKFLIVKTQRTFHIKTFSQVFEVLTSLSWRTVRQQEIRTNGEQRI